MARMRAIEAAVEILKKKALALLLVYPAQQ